MSVQDEGALWSGFCIYGAYNSGLKKMDGTWQFILVINTVMNKFQNLISMKFRRSESIKICLKIGPHKGRAP